jgi:hypothetical protein
LPKCCDDCPLAVLDKGKVFCIVHCQQVCWTTETRDPHCPLRERNEIEKIDHLNAPVKYKEIYINNAKKEDENI